MWTCHWFANTFVASVEQMLVPSQVKKVIGKLTQLHPQSHGPICARVAAECFGETLPS